MCRSTSHRRRLRTFVLCESRRRDSLRAVTTWRNRRQHSSRATSFAIIGESSGFSCAEVELTDYAPPGTLCGGPCSPTWVTVSGPSCMPGDSGGPVFSGDVAFGIAKGDQPHAVGAMHVLLLYVDRLSAAPWRLLVSGDLLRRDQVAPDLIGAGHGLGSDRCRSSRCGSAHRRERRAASSARASASLNTA